jgi:hypothetical protein
MSMSHNSLKHMFHIPANLINYKTLEREVNKDRETNKICILESNSNKEFKDEFIFNHDIFMEISKILLSKQDLIDNQYDSSIELSCENLRDNLKIPEKYIPLIAVRIIEDNHKLLIIENLKKHIKVQKDLNYLKGSTFCFPYNFLDVKREPFLNEDFDKHVMKFSFEENIPQPIPLYDVLTNYSDLHKKNILFLLLHGLYSAYHSEKKYVDFNLRPENLLIRKHNKHKFVLSYYDNLFKDKFVAGFIIESEYSPIILDLSSAKSTNGFFSNNNDGFNLFKNDLCKAIISLDFHEKLKNCPVKIENTKTLKDIGLFILEVKKYLFDDK